MLVASQFNEDFVRQGVEGGKQAAAALRNIILEHYGHIADDIEVMVKVCANVTGLSRALVRAESLENVNVFRDFTIGFTQGKASFEFLDVGHGKERADSKIRGMVKT
jgi:hypothetical protein